MSSNKEPQRSNAPTERQTKSSNPKGIVTVIDEKYPTPEERDKQIPNEPGTRRLHSERQSVEKGKRTK